MSAGDGDTSRPPCVVLPLSSTKRLESAQLVDQYPAVRQHVTPSCWPGPVPSDFTSLSPGFHAEDSASPMKDTITNAFSFESQVMPLGPAGLGRC